jgi:hypothetical protein
VLAAVVFGYLGLTRLADIQPGGEMGHSLRTAASYVVVIGLGVAIIGLARALSVIRHNPRLRPAVTAAGLLLAGIGTWQGTAAFSETAPVVADVGLAGFIVLVAVALSRLAVYGQSQRLGVFQGVFRWMASGRIAVPAAGLGVAVYVAFLSPRAPPYVDWVVVCLAGGLLLLRTGWLIRRDHVSRAGEPEWSPHRQEVRPKLDMEYGHLMRLQRGFVEKGDAVPLLNFLISGLSDNQAGEDDIQALVKPMMNHLDYAVPWYYVGQQRERAVQAVEEDRAQLLKQTLETVRSWVASSGGAFSAEGASLSELRRRFEEEGHREPLLIRLSLTLADAKMREEDAAALLRPLANHRGASATLPASGHEVGGRGGRRRLVQHLMAAADRYSPGIELEDVQ